jgi:hypothetical protein
VSLDCPFMVNPFGSTGKIEERKEKETSVSKAR